MPPTTAMNEDEEVCMVARPGDPVLLQPPATSSRLNGNFSVEGMSSLHTARHIVLSCLSAQGAEGAEGEMCDVLWIESVNSMMETGHFIAIYTPLGNGGQSTRVRVSYGKQWLRHDVLS